MCIGIPMQVKQTGFGFAVCEGMGITREVDTLLVGEQAVGTWLLVFLNSAREVLSEPDAEKITRAVQAVDMVMSSNGKLASGGLGEQHIETLFSDLINRDPPKPDSLLALEQQNGPQKKSTES